MSSRRARALLYILPHLVEIVVRREEAHHPPRNGLAHVAHQPPELVQLLVRAPPAVREVERLARGTPGRTIVVKN